jgi:hypothetical protein
MKGELLTASVRIARTDGFLGEMHVLDRHVDDLNSWTVSGGGRL